MGGADHDRAAGQREPARAHEPAVERFGPRPASGRTILVGVDGSDTAMRAAAYAFGLARRQGYQLFAAFVAERSNPSLTCAAVAFEHGPPRSWACPSRSCWCRATR